MISNASRCIAAALFLAISACTHVALAHHTFVRKYDSAKTITLSGVVTSVSFSNPHIEFQVAAGSGSWTVETESLSAAQSKGLTQSHLKEGAKVTITGWPARDGSAELGLKSISFSGGPSITMRGTAR